ncbi:MAG: RNA methyltransferase [Verrucomicrobia bacterium]|nr:RNA methyltransferase [Verrucomicrobiota bacterium]
MQISSAQNPKIKQLLHLRDRKERDESGLFLIEGYREISRAVKGGVHFVSVFICPQLFLGENEKSLLAQIPLKPYELPPHLFEKISYRDRPDGLVAIAHQMKRTLKDIHFQNKIPFLVIAEAIEKPGNLGTILRSADAAGADGVIVCDRCTDIYNPNVVRASVGTLFTLPVVEATSAETFTWLQKHSVQVVAATPAASLEFTDADLSGPLAIAVGTEQIGLSEIWMKAADIQIRIPMNGVADSLNVATATTLILYEALRQRKHRFPG